MFCAILRLHTHKLILLHVILTRVAVLQGAADEGMGVLSVLAQDSQFPCFRGRDTSSVIAAVRSRLRPDLSRDEVVDFVEGLVQKSLNNQNTKNYDKFQWLSMGIHK